MSKHKKENQEKTDPNAEANASENNMESCLKDVSDESAKCEELLTAEKNKYAYLMAEYQNYRKRAAKEASDARFSGTANAIGGFLKVADFLNMAEQAAVKSDNLDSIKQGLQMIIAEYHKCFDELGVSRLDTVGKPFNPELHEAVAHEPSEQVAENHVIKEWSSGYKLGERLLRPARVVVSSGPQKTVNEE